MERKFCQSCGMPLDTGDVTSENEDYCIYCFKNGKFTENVTMEEMIAISLRHMKEMFANDPNFNEDEALTNMRSFFPELKRWAKQ